MRRVKNVQYMRLLGLIRCFSLANSKGDNWKERDDSKRGLKLRLVKWLCVSCVARINGDIAGGLCRIRSIFSISFLV